jgi:hypothetical protein
MRSVLTSMRTLLNASLALLRASRHCNAQVSQATQVVCARGVGVRTLDHERWRYNLVTTYLVLDYVGDVHTHLDREKSGSYRRMLSCYSAAADFVKWKGAFKELKLWREDTEENQVYHFGCLQAESNV